MSKPKTFFGALAEGFHRNSDLFDKAARGAEVADGIEQALSDGLCGRCRVVKATVSIDGKVIFCAACAKTGARAIGKIARHTAEATGILEGEDGELLGGFLKGLIGDGK